MRYRVRPLALGEGALVWLLRLAAAVLALVACAAYLTGGARVELGPVRISATSPGRLALQASFCWLVAAVLSAHAEWARRRLGDSSVRARAPLASVPVAIVLVALAALADSHPQRVGDGVEYVAIAMNLARLQPPALSAGDATMANATFDATSGFEHARVPPGIVGRDGRRDMHHFWLYSLVAAPGVAMTSAVGFNANSAFTFVNAAFFLGLLWLLTASEPPTFGSLLAAALLLTGPPLWWLDKAHAEVFLFVTIAVAVLVVERRAWWALVSAALAAAQNPTGLVVLGAIGGYVVLTAWRPVPSSTRAAPRLGSAFAAMCVAVLVAAAAPAYYFWHLGTWSPLASTVNEGVPSLRALLTPLIDLNLGLVWHAPVLAVLCLVGFVAAESRTRAFAAVLTLGLLVVFAQVVNVNHGGTPGMSRYALWLLAAWAPLAVTGAQRLARGPRPLVAVAVLASVTLTWFLFRPTLADRAAASPSALASLAWTTWPSLENPLPEVFAERLSGIDGAPPIPVATPACEKVLTLGDGREAQWPFPCAPRPVPAACVTVRALCYVNGIEVVATTASRFQPMDMRPSHAWTVADARGLDALVPVLGRGAQHRRSTGPRRRVASLDGLEWSYIVEGERGTAAWVRARSDADPPVLRIRVERQAHVEVRRSVGVSGLGRSTPRGGDPDAPYMRWDLQAGEHDVALPGTDLALVVIAESE